MNIRFTSREVTDFLIEHGMVSDEIVIPKAAVTQGDKSVLVKLVLLDPTKMERGLTEDGDFCIIYTGDLRIERVEDKDAQ